MAFDLCLGNQGQKTKDLVGGLITARNEVGARLCFTRVCDSVHGGGGGWYPSMHCKWYPSMPCSRSPGEGVVSQHAFQVCRPIPRGEVEGSGWGEVSRPTPRGCIPACTETDPPPPMATAAGGTHPTGMHSCL